MTTYTFNTLTGVLTKDDGSVIPQDDTLQAYQDYTTWLGQGNSPTLIDVVTDTTRRHITVLAFRNRFTTAEKIAIDMASIDNPAGTQQTRALQASLRVYQKDLDNATYVDLDRADTQAGVNTLETYGIIGTGRASEILNAPVQPIERPTAHDYLGI